MKRIILALMVCASLTFSCSEDKDEDVMLESTALVGVWKFSKIEATDASGNIKLANDILTVLVASGCDILNYNFKEDQTVTASFRDFTETGNSVNSGGTGLLIQCPQNVQASSSVWSLEGDKLSFIDGKGRKVTVSISIDGDTLTVPGEVINADNLTGTNALFKKQ
ncbi:MAG: lipocalin family protein [Cellulophaga sp.]|nr:lipocalin family protein [Cellulophaga sp.]